MKSFHALVDLTIHQLQLDVLSPPRIRPVSHYSSQRPSCLINCMNQTKKSHPWPFRPSFPVHLAISSLDGLGNSHDTPRSSTATSSLSTPSSSVSANKNSSTNSSPWPPTLSSQRPLTLSMSSGRAFDCRHQVNHEYTFLFSHSAFSLLKIYYIETKNYISKNTNSVIQTSTTKIEERTHTKQPLPSQIGNYKLQLSEQHSYFTPPSKIYSRSCESGESSIATLILPSCKKKVFYFVSAFFDLIFVIVKLQL